MEPVTVLVIEDSAAEATLLRTALARCEIRVVEPPTGRAVPIALAIAGSKALIQSPAELVKTVEKGVPIVGVVAGLSQKARKRALAAGVREIHERPREWRPYSELIASLVERFVRT